FVSLGLSTCGCTTILFIIPATQSTSYFPYTTLFRSWQSVGIWSKRITSYLQRKNSVPETSRYSVPWITEPETLRAKSHRWCDTRSEEHTSELQSRFDLVCRLLLEKKKDDESITIVCY